MRAHLGIQASSYSAEESRHNVAWLETVCRSVWRQWSSRVTKEDWHDCIVIAKVEYWRITQRYPEASDAFVATCIRRAVTRLLANQAAVYRREVQGADAAYGSLADAANPAEFVCSWSELLTGMNPQDRDLINLAYYHCMTDSEIAEVLSITPCAARKRRQRLVQRLRTKITAWVEITDRVTSIPQDE